MGIREEKLVLIARFVPNSLTQPFLDENVVAARLQSLDIGNFGDTKLR
jgi:hypothetical protein